jgi:hypothetical protein
MVNKCTKVCTMVDPMIMDALSAPLEAAATSTSRAASDSATGLGGFTFTLSKGRRRLQKFLGPITIAMTSGMGKAGTGTTTSSPAKSSSASKPATVAARGTTSNAAAAGASSSAAAGVNAAAASGANAGVSPTRKSAAAAPAAAGANAANTRAPSEVCVDSCAAVPEVEWKTQCRPGVVAEKQCRTEAIKTCMPKCEPVCKQTCREALTSEEKLAVAIKDSIVSFFSIGKGK